MLLRGADFGLLICLVGFRLMGFGVWVLLLVGLWVDWFNVGNDLLHRYYNCCVLVVCLVVVIGVAGFSWVGGFLNLMFVWV